MTNPTPAPEPTPDPAPPSLFSDPAQETAFKALIKSAVKEYAEENKPAPDKTKRPPSFLDSLFGS